MLDVKRWKELTDMTPEDRTILALSLGLRGDASRVEILAAEVQRDNPDYHRRLLELIPDKPWFDRRSR